MNTKQHSQVSMNAFKDHGITEIFTANFHHDYENFIYPMLSYLSNEPGKRWFSWISSYPTEERKKLANFKYNKNRIQILHSKTYEDSLWLTWEALASGLSDIVVATVPTLYDLIIKGEIENQSLNKGDIILFASVGAGMNINAIVYKM